MWNECELKASCVPGTALEFGMHALIDSLNLPLIVALSSLTHFADEEIEAQSPLAQDLPGSWWQRLEIRFPDPSIPFPSHLSFPA